jgi:ferredoxin
VELLKLHQLQRDQVHIVGVPCTGIVDIKKVARICDPATITALYEDGDTIVIETTRSRHTCARDELVYDKCIACAYPNPLVYDELVGEEVASRQVDPQQKFADVQSLEEMDVTDRLGFWSEQLSKCIRCYACKNVCPMCFCTECLWEKRDPQWVTKYRNPDDVFTFHMIRAYHMAGRCTGCMECERVCPVDIPLGKIFKKIEKDCLELFEYQPGVDIQAVPPLSMFEEGDTEHEDLLR